MRYEGEDSGKRSSLLQFPHGSNKKISSNAATTVDIPTNWNLQQRRPLPAAETGRSCWGSGQQNASAAQGAKQTLGAATRGTKQQPTGLLLTLLRRVVLFDSRTGQKNPSSIAATTVDIPIGWNPNTKKEPTGLFFTACGRPCSFDSSYGFSDFHLFLTFLQIGTRALRNSPLGCCLSCCAGSCCSIPVRVKKKSLEHCSRDFMTRTGIEPMLQP